MESATIGIAESGKGDFLGPLVVGACLVDAKVVQELPELARAKLSVQACLEADKRLRSLVPFVVLSIQPEQYNALYDKLESANRILGWAHAQTLAELAGRTDCRAVVGLEVGDKAALLHLLDKKGHSMQIDSGPGAKRHPACAAAGILARAEYLRSLDRLSEECGVRLVRGANDNAVAVGADVLAKGGKQGLIRVAKAHFRSARASSKLIERGEIGSGC